MLCPPSLRPQGLLSGGLLLQGQGGHQDRGVSGPGSSLLLHIHLWLMRSLDLCGLSAGRWQFTARLLLTQKLEEAELSTTAHVCAPLMHNREPGTC